MEGEELYGGDEVVCLDEKVSFYARVSIVEEYLVVCSEGKVVREGGDVNGGSVREMSYDIVGDKGVVVQNSDVSVVSESNEFNRGRDGYIIVFNE
jgi:hypothetical protein